MGPEEKLQRISAEVQRSGNVPPETIALFAVLLSIPIDDTMPRHEAPAEQIKNLTLDALRSEERRVGKEC